MLDLIEFENELAAREAIDRLSADLAALEVRQQSESADWQRWKLVIDTSNDAFITADMTGNLLEWNIKAEQLFGWSRNDAVGQNLADTIFPADQQPRQLGGLQRLLNETANGKRIETLARCRDGSEIPVEVSIAPMRHGGSFVFNAFMHDISRRRQLQMKLAHAQKLESIGQLSAGIAHEINTPTQYVGDNTRFIQDALADVFTVIAAYGQLTETVRSGGDTTHALTELDRLVKEVDLDYLLTEMDSAVDQTLDGIARVTKIVRAMKEFSHPGTASKVPTNLNHAISNTLMVATNEWKYVADVVTEFEPDLPLVPCLPGDFNQVLLNLIVNAAHAIGDVVASNPGSKGRITARTHSSPTHVEISIEDTGTGIAPDVIGRVFDPFFTTKEVGVGTGQGLAIARSVVVDKHGGTIDVESSLGSGAKFVIRLPIAAQGATL